VNFDKLPRETHKHLHAFYKGYSEAAREAGLSQKEIDAILEEFVTHVAENARHPFQFEPFHRQIRSPHDHFRMGQEFFRPLIDLPASEIRGQGNLHTIATMIRQGENVVLLANHQVEPDPQALMLLLENGYADLLPHMVFVAGHKVTTDLLAVPLSMGLNLVCIYSKKYVATPPENRAEKLAHNQKAMKRLKQLLDEGRCCLYVAPSGGRDRPNAHGILEVAPFDVGSVEMFYLLAQGAKSPTHLFTLAMRSFDLMPPPDQERKEVGEKRQARRVPVHLAFGKELHFDPPPPGTDKQEARRLRAEKAFFQVLADYMQL